MLRIAAVQFDGRRLDHQSLDRCRLRIARPDDADCQEQRRKRNSNRRARSVIGNAAWRGSIAGEFGWVPGTALAAARRTPYLILDGHPTAKSAPRPNPAAGREARRPLDRQRLQQPAPLLLAHVEGGLDHVGKAATGNWPVLTSRS